MKLQSLTIIFIIIILPVTLVLSAYIGYEIKTANKQNYYNAGLLSATHDAVFAFELNTKNDDLSNNAEKKRSDIKAAVKTFENSFSTKCNLGLYNNEEIENYIPAVVFGLYDGFYMYAPSQTESQGYKHNLRNYVYYSETLPGSDIIIRYSLDNYVVVSGTINESYQVNSGYLVNPDDVAISGSTVKYKNLVIEKENLKEYKGKYNPNNTNENLISKNNDTSAKDYYKSAKLFTEWFNKISSLSDDLKITSENDPEDENSPFVQHKRKIMKDKIQGILNSSITSYSKKIANKNYKMPVFSENDWQKIYSNISVISFVQGMNLGFKEYNNYCILNSTNNQEYVNPNLMYFIDNNGEYHDIRCTEITNENTTGYKIGDFEKVTTEISSESDATKKEKEYYYKHIEAACYKCINGNLGNNIKLYSYVRNGPGGTIKSYFTSLARERYNTAKLSDDLSMNKYLIEMCNKSANSKNKVVEILNKIKTRYSEGIKIRYYTTYNNTKEIRISYLSDYENDNNTKRPTSLELSIDSQGYYLITIK